MRLFYTAGIIIYKLAISLIAPFNKKAKNWIDGRKGWEKTLTENIPKDKLVIWFHCASLGEFEQGRSVIEAYKTKQPEHFILLTFFSPSGYEIRKNYTGADYVCYLPLDTEANSKKFIQLTRPIKAYFIKYEFWFNYLKELQNKNIKTYLISGIFRKNQHFFKWYGSWFKGNLSAFSHFYLQNNQSGKLLSSIYYENFTVCGDTRFDRVNELVNNAKPIQAIEKFSKENYTVIAGSTWPKDEELLLALIEQNTDIKLVIAPHEIDENHLNKLRNLFGKTAGFFTKGEFDKKVLIIDTIGLLSSIYRYGKWAYIGGGFGSGIHNTLEAVSYGIPVIFGPNYHKFQEAIDLVKLNSAVSINHTEEFLQTANRWIINEDIVKKMGNSGRTYVKSNLGATEKIISDTTKN